MFRAFVKAKQHRKPNGRLKSYREIAAEIGGTKSHNTINNWMREDYPAIARAMGGADGPGSGGPRDHGGRHPEAELFDSGVRGAKNASAAARGILNPQMRGQLVEALRTGLHTAETAGPYDLNEAQDAF